LIVGLGLILALGLGVWLFVPTGGDEEADRHEEAGPVGGLAMSAADREARGILSGRVEKQVLIEEMVAPGEVVADVYHSSQIAPRIAAQVVARHARQGHKVQRGQKLVTLSSVEMAKAQGDLIVAQQEWRRVQALGRDLVSERRYIEAQVAAQQAYAKILAYGIAPEQAAAFAKAGDPAKATGAFDLFAPQQGVIVKDEFITGQHVEPGYVLMEIVDESVVGVEARLTTEQAPKITPGMTARIRADGNQWLEGRVTHLHHSLDPATRTLTVRIEVENKEDRLHPGQFVDVAIASGAGQPVLAVPTEAVVLMEGVPIVFKIEGERLRPLSVEIGASRGGWTEIEAGLAEGEEIVVAQAFLLKSLIMKSQMGEGH
jgi:cobalt-zinc-cadmium efflux system membrane fusion protein